MKLQALAATVLAATALVGGSALAQATMQPVPNPPEKAMSHKMMHHHGMKHHHGMMHHHGMKHHAMKKHHKMAMGGMAKPAADASAPAATPK